MMSLTLKALIPIGSLLVAVSTAWGVAQYKISLHEGQISHLEARANSLEQHEASHDAVEAAVVQELRDLKEHMILDLGQIRDDIHEIRQEKHK